ncbi:EAL domain-containing protein [Crassaminicella indica]|uniref:EAL domain-containing protein n=1 Tax=Crassaminicella indica TaxID=2855394 RepID=A0ABX8RDL0_9CLOT|nr:EAL domain-containing protein [Crassaminicella indica]QXM07152.1 EAL domain-containing protein [Crassaminicella indica]
MKKNFIIYLILAMVFSNILLAIMIDNYVENKIDHILEDQKQDIINQSKEILFAFDTMLLTIDQELKEKTERDILAISKALEKKIKNQSNITNDEMKKLAQKFSVSEIYIIDKEGTVIYTSFPYDENFNLFKIGKAFERFLKSIYGQGKVKHQSITVSSNTGILNRYTYYSPKESDYIISISVDIKDYVKKYYPKKYYEFVFSRLFHSFIEDNKYLVGIDIYSHNKVNSWSLLHTGKKFDKAPSLINKLKNGEKIYIYKDGLYHSYHAFKFHDAGHDFTKKVYIELVYDFSALERNKSDVFAFAIGISFLIILITFFITSKFFDKCVIKKVNMINYGLKMIAEGQYDHRIEIDSKDEFSDIAKTINEMKENIRCREEELLKRREQIHYLAYYDSLTGLPNRVLFEEKLSIALEDAKLTQGKLALLYMDLDNFKKVNDTIGHTFGDLLLKNVGRLLKKYLGEKSTVTRLGGDEFVAVLPRVDDLQELVAIIENIIKSFQNPWILDDREFYITVSIGITLYPRDGKTPHILLKNADTAMYSAKNNGKNSYRFYTSDLNEKMLEKLEMENNLRHAVERNEFMVYYQPKVHMHTGRITGVEALIRWKHPTKGMIPPSRFIPIAEETKMIIPIGEWVLRNACRQIKSWEELGYPAMTVSVNLSVIQIQQPDFLEKIKSILKETGIKPSCLELEITENTIMKDFEFTNNILNALKKLGIRISLDDFGKGYSSLNYLKQLEIDVLKIDKAFVDDITENDHQQAIVKAVIDMAHSMNITVVAEGVETWEQFKFLKSLNCDKVQGYLFSKPLPVMEMEEMMREKKKIC